MSQFARLDREHEDRIMQLWRSFEDDKDIDLLEIFSSNSIVPGLDHSKVILPNYDLYRILAAYPFSQQLYVSFCPICSKKADPRHLHHLLEHEAITPVLAGRYEDFDPKFISIVVSHPHISMHEFLFYRVLSLTSTATGQVCQHCVNERRRQYIELIQKKNIGSNTIELVETCLTNLYPYLGPDFELVDQLGSALKSNDGQRLQDIESVSFAVRDARTNQAYSARTTIPAAAVPGLLQEAASLSVKIDVDDVRLVESALASNLHLEIPGDVDVSKYLSCLEHYRNELAGIVDGIIDDVNESPGRPMTTLSARLADLNDELKKLSRSKSYLTYRAMVGFMRSNKAIIASGLLATALGLSGNLLGCGVSLASGAGTQLVKRFGKVKVPGEVNALVDEVRDTVRPHVHKLVGKYLDVDVRAVQLWEIREKLHSTPRTDSLPKKRSSGQGRRRS